MWSNTEKRVGIKVNHSSNVKNGDVSVASCQTLRKKSIIGKPPIAKRFPLGSNAIAEGISR